MKKISLLIFILLNFMLSALAQQKSPNSIQNTEIEELVDYDKVKIKPQFKGETWAFYLSHNLRYPENALKALFSKLNYKPKKMPFQRNETAFFASYKLFLSYST